MKQQIAIFGSAFNPPTIGHLSVIHHIWHYDKILLAPSIAHAWGKEMLDFDLRCELVSRFISDINGSSDINGNKVEGCFVERELFDNQQAVTTYMLLTYLQDQYPDAELTFVMGPDNLLNFKKFSHAEEIVSHWKLLACPETIKVRSSLVRQSISDREDYKHMVTSTVANFIETNHCYR